MKKYHCKFIIAAAICAAIIPVASCGGEKNKPDEIVQEMPADDSYIYDHLDKIVNQYSNLLMTTPIEGKEMEELLMDINSRCQMLAEQGDTLKALYFHHAIEHNVRQRDSVRADRIFGRCPYTAFNPERD